MANRWRSSKTKDTVLSAVFEFPEIIFFDTETTGLKAEQDYIIELAAIKYTMTQGVQLEEKERLHLYLKPPFEVSGKITELTGITNAFLADKPTFEEKFSEIYTFFGEHPLIAAYNTPFDHRFMAASYERSAPNGEKFEPAAVLDVLEMARDKVAKEDTVNYKLETIAALFGLDDAQFHSAIEDVRVTKLLFDVFYKEYMEESPTDAEEKLRPCITSLSFYKGYKGFDRIYVNTDTGSMFYDIRAKNWGGKDVDIDSMDMEYVEQMAWNLAGVNNQKDFEKFKGKVTA